MTSQALESAKEQLANYRNIVSIYSQWAVAAAVGFLTGVYYDISNENGDYFSAFMVCGGLVVLFIILAFRYSRLHSKLRDSIQWT